MMHYGDNLSVCKVCDKSLSRPGLKHHMLTYSGEKPYICLICKLAFRSKGGLRSHKVTHSMEKPYECKFCRSRFKNNPALKNHLLVHGQEKPYKCELCRKCLKRKTTLKFHLYTHIKSICSKHKVEIKTTKALKTNEACYKKIKDLPEISDLKKVIQ